MANRKLTIIRISKKALHNKSGRPSDMNYIGAGEGIRTLDVLLGKQALYR